MLWLRPRLRIWGLGVRILSGAPIHRQTGGEPGNPAESTGPKPFRDTRKGYTMAARMPYVQLWKGSYRFRRKVPDDVRPALRTPNWKALEWTAPLDTRDLAEANRRVLPHIERTDKVIEAVQAGEWPPLRDEAVELTVYKWMAWEGREEPFENEGQLVASLTKFIVTHDIEIRIPGGNFEKVKRAAIGEHHDEFGGYAADVERKQKNRLAARMALEAVARGQTPKIMPVVPAPVAETVQKAIEPGADNLPISKLFEKWLAYRKPPGKTPQEWATAIRRFSEVVGQDIGVRSITKAHAREYRDALLKMPRNLTNAMRTMTVPEIIAATEGKDMPRLAGRAVNKNIGALGSVIEYGVENDYCEINAFSGVKAHVDKNEKKRLAYTSDHLTTIFGSKVFVEASRKPDERPADFWLPVLGLLHGCRLEELSQALVTDVKTEVGITYFDINTLDDRGKRLKTANAHRRVPVHPEAIRIGFLAYVEAMRKKGESRLFPNVKSAPGRPLSAAWSKWWGRYNTKLGITDSRFTYHSLRHNFKTLCREAGLDEELHDVLTGHAGGGVGRDYGDYPLKTLADAMARIKTPVSLKHLHVKKSG
jgi:integrase